MNKVQSITKCHIAGRGAVVRQPRPETSGSFHSSVSGSCRTATSSEIRPDNLQVTVSGTLKLRIYK